MEVVRSSQAVLTLQAQDLERWSRQTRTAPEKALETCDADHHSRNHLQVRHVRRTERGPAMNESKFPWWLVLVTIVGITALVWLGSEIWDAGIVQ